MTTATSLEGQAEVSGLTRVNRRAWLQRGAAGAAMVATAAVTAAVTAVSTPGLATAAPVTVLRHSDHEPLGGMRTRFLADVLFPAIERESQGRLRIDAHWNGERASAYDALAAVGERRTVDLATVVPEYFAKQMPVHQLFKSFPTGPAGQVQVAFFRRAYAQAPAFTRELQAIGTVPVFLGTGYPVAFFSREPMSDLQGLRQGRWRTASFWHQDFLRNTGATPVSMPWGPGVYEALKARSLDGLMVNVDSGYLLKVHEAAPHVLLSRDLWLGHLYVLAMGEPAWNALSPDDQAAFRRAAESSYAVLGAVMDRHLDAQIGLLRDQAARVRVLDGAEVRQWAGSTRYTSVQDAWVAAQQAVPGLQETLATCRALMGEAGR